MSSISLACTRHCTFWMTSLMRWINTKIENYVIIASLKSETMRKLINRIPASLGFENACWIARQASRCQQAFSKPCLVNLISKDTHQVFSISRQASRCQQAFSKPCLVNFISKDTHLVFSIYFLITHSYLEAWIIIFLNLLLYSIATSNHWSTTMCLATVLSWLWKLPNCTLLHWHRII